jgi:hypothetical protein
MRLLDYLNHVDNNLNHIAFFMEVRMGAKISTHTNDFSGKKNVPNFPDF